jgi:hypothetical protein
MIKGIGYLASSSKSTMPTKSANVKESTNCLAASLRTSCVEFQG